MSKIHLIDSNLYIIKALNLLPAAGPYLKRKLDHNRSEACLIALYGTAQKGYL